jgi:hypothetical protein
VYYGQSFLSTSVEECYNLRYFSYSLSTIFKYVYKFLGISLCKQIFKGKLYPKFILFSIGESTTTSNMRLNVLWLLWSSHGGSDLYVGLKCIGIMYVHSVKSLNIDR